MNCKKEGSLICKGLHIGEEDLEKINSMTRREFSEDELYCFRVVLCDNDIDRQMEQFDVQTLEELAGLFLGKTGIFDHEPSVRNQQARIYETSVENFPGKLNSLGEPYYALVAKAYMVRTEGNRDLILEIEAGIKKEVSVGCSVAQRLCSICQRERDSFHCEHIPGEVYDGKLCYTILHGALDAYEWSFVAVPAQRQAGVIKGASGSEMAVQKLWKASSGRRGLWLDAQEVYRLQHTVKNLLEDCEQVRRSVRREVTQELFTGKSGDHRESRELYELLDQLTVGQMKALKKMLRREEPVSLQQPQLHKRETDEPVSDRSFII